MTSRIKKVQIIRIKAYGGKLSNKQEVLAELPSIKMANAAVREWQSIGHEAQRSINRELSDDKPGSHYGCYVWREICLGPDSFGFDRYWNEDFWHNGKEILTERIYTNVIR
jgi:hypothetical protein